MRPPPPKTRPTHSSFSQKLCSAPLWPTSMPWSRRPTSRTRSSSPTVSIRRSPDRLHGPRQRLRGRDRHPRRHRRRPGTRTAIRHARELFNDPIPAMKCHAQASLMMRTANAACCPAAPRPDRPPQARGPPRHLQPGRLDRAVPPGPAAHRRRPPRRRAAAAPARTRANTGTPRPPTKPDHPLQRSRAVCVNYPNRAAEIRAYGGVPPTARYGHPELKLVREIIASTSPILQQLDERIRPRHPHLTKPTPPPPAGLSREADQGQRLGGRGEGASPHRRK